MRVAMVVSSFPRLSETFLVSKFDGLLARGTDVHVVCQSSDKGERARFAPLHADRRLAKRVHVAWPQRPRWLALALAPAAALRCMLRSPHGTVRYLKCGFGRFGWDVLRRLYLDAELVVLRPHLIHFEFGALAAERAYLKQLLGCKLVVSFRGYDLNTVGLEDPEHYGEVWESADALHLLSSALWRTAQQRGCDRGKEHALIPPAIDASFFDPGGRTHREATGTPERPLRILSVGRLTWEKGYEYALAAARRLADRGVHFEYRILGQGEHLEAVAFARHEMGLDSSAVLLGAGGRDQVKEQMLWADVLLHASVSEGFCNAVIEAQSMGLPVVCSDAGGLPENVADGETGFVVPRRDPGALADRLELLAGDAALRNRMGLAGIRRARTHFALHDQITAFDCLYRRVMRSERVAKDGTPGDEATVPAPCSRTGDEHAG